jgi:hypothetical protein
VADLTLEKTDCSKNVWPAPSARGLIESAE